MLRLSIENFDGTTLRDDRGILAVFHADWCPFCRSFVKLLEMTMKARTEILGAVVDLSNNENPLWETFDIQIVPTLVGFRKREVIARKDGLAGAGLSSLDIEEVLRQMETR